MMRQRSWKSVSKAALAALLLLAAQPALGEGAGVVNVNTAGPEELALLPRVGPAVAGRIVEFREANGAFRSPEELMLVRGIGARTFELIKPYISLTGETTLAEKVRLPREAGSGD